jgi:hypothetical protein
VCAASGQAGRRAIKNGGHLRAQKCHVVHNDLERLGLEPPQMLRTYSSRFPSKKGEGYGKEI